ncbi:MAG: flagellar protein FlaG [Burkholderiales bacterium]|nr:flagellar protein FlaG [Burkholderiales bacterium]
MSISSLGMSLPGSMGMPSPATTPAQPAQNAPQQTTQNTEPAHTVDQVKQAASQINKVIQSFDQSLQFVVDQSTGKVLVQVVDTANNQVIRQIPSKEAIAISQALDKLQGLLIRQQA